MGVEEGGMLDAGGVLDAGGALDVGAEEEAGAEDSAEEAADVSFSTDPALKSRMIKPTSNKNRAQMVAIRMMVRLLLR